ncbi:SCO family protein [Rhizobacter sp. OV335]|uniref:SCO family protein n=1 Tax=Rhizobacter sp. OV335 TaxID=1500264 RepID=UPI0013563E85|nr:SCO family protein [Rhizobacter sp. OV335]
MRRTAVLCLALAVMTAGVSAVSLWADWHRPDSILAHDTLPFYASADLRPRWDRVSSVLQVDGFEFTDQRKTAVDDRLLDSGPTVVNLFFAGCVSVCPVSMDLLRTLQANLGSQAPRFVSLTVSPLTDDVRALADYAGKFVLPKDWVLLTGHPQAVEAWARRSLYSDITKIGPDGLPPHTERAFLIDRGHRIRGIYDARSPHEMVRLRYDIARLRQEEAPAFADQSISPSSPSEVAVVVRR